MIGYIYGIIFLLAKYLFVEMKLIKILICFLFFLNLTL